MFSAKGAAFSASLGQRPRIYGIPSASAESVIHFQPPIRSNRPIETRFQRLFNTAI